MIAISGIETSITKEWIRYCKEENIPYKIVDCYRSNIMDQLNDCDALMWHINHMGSKDVKFAKQLHYSLQIVGKKVFPDFNTVWHFDDKVGQKYLFESIGAPAVPTHVFYSKADAILWVNQAQFPKVFKLRGGAGSANVRLVKTRYEAFKLVNRAFGRGFRQFDAYSGLKERWRKFRLGRGSLLDLAKGVVRFIYRPEYDRVAGSEKGYIYFQDFIPNNDHDIRVIVIGGKAFAIKRLVRHGDFRASGSGHILYEKKYFDDKVIQLSFDINDKIQSQCLALDYVFDNGSPKLVEVSYCFSKEGYDPCVGYWDRSLNFYEGKFNPYGWMVDMVIR